MIQMLMMKLSLTVDVLLFDFWMAIVLQHRVLLLANPQIISSYHPVEVTFAMGGGVANSIASPARQFRE